MYVVDEFSDEPIMLIDKWIGDVGDGEGMGIDGSLFQRELLMLDGMGKKRIQVWINSPGGVVSDGYSIYNAIIRTKTKVDTYCIGIAASISAVIFQGGRKRYIADYGILMFHNPCYVDDKEKVDESLKATCESINTMIATRSGMTPEQVAKMMDKETFVEPVQALTMGLADEIEASFEFNKKRVTAPAINKENSKAYWKESNKILNKILQTKNSHKMSKVCNKLNLSPDASEDSIVNEITGLQNGVIENKKKLEDKEKELTDKKDELDKKGKEYDDLKKEHDKLKNEMDAFKKKADEDTETNKLKDAKNMVEGFAKVGKIKNDAPTINAWAAKAKDDMPGIKAMLESIPTNKKAEKFETVEGGETALVTEIKGGVAMDMIRIANKLNNKN